MCYPNEKPPLLGVKAPLFKTSYTSFSFVLLLIVVGLCGLLALVIYMNGKKKNGGRMHRSRSYHRRKTIIDEKYAMKHMGEGSVYMFFMSTRKTGWAIALVTIASQVALVRHSYALFSSRLVSSCDLISSSLAFESNPARAVHLGRR